MKLQILKHKILRAIVLVLSVIAGLNYLTDQTVKASHSPVTVPEMTMHWQGEMSGEVTQNSVILQARLAVNGKVRFGDVRGRPGVGAFAISTEEDFRNAFRTAWMTASPENDFIIKTNVIGLEPGTKYYYRLLSGKSNGDVRAGPTGTFRTLDAKGTQREVSFVVVTGMNRLAFRYNSKVKNKDLGYPALEAIVNHNPDFFVATGDNVYYDTPYIGRAKTRKEMRAKWHRQFATSRFQNFFLAVPVYWEKDDHDYRYNDSDPHGSFEPSHELGIKTFLEQVPVADPGEKNPVTYRTHRINDLLQVWLLEGRDYRDPNTMPPGPDKTMWGTEQREWLKRTLLESDAVFKIIVSPTPLVGPDDMITGVQSKLISKLIGGAAIGQGGDNRKRDNHTNPYGFKDEADAFFKWLKENDFLNKNLYLACGDRHWQYHSIHPSGFEEFSSGALVDGNARLGRRPGDPESTDPDGLISQPYAQDEKSGGFLKITISPDVETGKAKILFSFYDEHGELLYNTEKIAQ